MLSIPIKCLESIKVVTNRLDKRRLDKRDQCKMENVYKQVKAKIMNGNEYRKRLDQISFHIAIITRRLAICK